MVLGQKSSRPRYDEELEDESEGRGSFSPNFNQATQTGELPSDIKEQLNNLILQSGMKMKMMLSLISRNLLKIESRTQSNIRRFLQIIAYII